MQRGTSGLRGSVRCPPALGAVVPAEQSLIEADEGADVPMWHPEGEMRRLFLDPRSRRPDRRRGDRARAGRRREGRARGLHVRPRAGQARARRRARAAGRPARAVEHDPRRRPRGVRAPDRRAGGHAAGDQQVGLVVPALPRRVPDLPGGRHRARQGDRLPRRQRRGQAARGREVPQRAPAALPVLRGPRRDDREGAEGAQVLPDDGVRRRRRRAVHQGRRVHVAGRARGRHRQVPR